MNNNNHAGHATKTGNYGIRIRLPDGDPFAELVGADWSTEHWYNTQTERDQAMADMAQEHIYSRDGDRPTLEFTAIERNITTT